MKTNAPKYTSPGIAVWSAQPLFAFCSGRAGPTSSIIGPLEPTKEPYAIAKIAGIKLCESYNRQYGAIHGIDYRSVMPTNK